MNFQIYYEKIIDLIVQQVHEECIPKKVVAVSVGTRQYIHIRQLNKIEQQKSKFKSYEKL